MSREELYASKKSLGIPDKIEVQKMKELLQQYVVPGDAVLVLGATPELRNIALELGCKVLSMDINLEMISKREKNVTTKDHDRDVVARSNWLQPWFVKEHFFKAVIGDTCFTNLPYPQMIELFGIIKRLLQKEGVIIVRHAVLYDEHTPDQLVSLYKQGEITAKDMIILTHMNRHFKRPYVNKTVDMNTAFEHVASFLKKHKISRKLCEYIKSHQFNGIHMFYEKREFEKDVEKHLGKPTCFVSDNVFYSRAAPIYLIKSIR